MEGDAIWSSIAASWPQRPQILIFQNKSRIFCARHKLELSAFHSSSYPTINSPLSTAAGSKDKKETVERDTFERNQRAAVEG